VNYYHTYHGAATHFMLHCISSYVRMGYTKRVYDSKPYLEIITFKNDSTYCVRVTVDFRCTVSNERVLT
jgi:hypothetical protein